MKFSPLGSGVAVAAVILLLVFAFDLYDQRVHHERQQAALVQELRLMQARIEGLFDRYRYLGSGLADYVATYPEVSPSEFAVLMRRLARDDALLLGMVLLRDGEPSHVYAPPPRTATSAAGPPLRLYLPVSLPAAAGARPAWAVEFEFDRSALLAEAGAAMSLKGGSVEIALRGHAGQLIVGTPELFAVAQAQLDIRAPGGPWTLAGRITPPRVEGPSWYLLLGLMCAALGGLLTWLLRREHATTRHLALHDCLTGLPNRRLLQDRVEHACAAAARSGKRIVLMYLDLDSFKPVNDNYGHHAGDQVLREVALRLCDCVRRSDTVARVSGDEFVLALSELTLTAEAEPVAEKVLAGFARPIVVGEHAFVLGCSMGLVAMEDGCDVHEALARADSAMYQAKRDGKNSYRWYLPEPEQLNLEVAAETA